MKRFIFSILLLSGIVSLASTAQEYMVFTPQWTAQAQFAGYYVAKEKGFYMKAGLDVEIIHPSVTQSAINRIRNNESQATTLQLAQAMEIIDEGIVSRRGMNPLKQIGAKVGIWNAGFGQVAMCMSMKDGLDYNWIPFASNVNLFISGAIDATLAMSYNEYYQLLQTGIEITPDNVYRFCDHGYNIQEDGVYMTREYFEKHKDQAYRFAEASRQGWEWAVENPEETLDIVMEYVQKEHIPTNRVLQKLMLDDVLRLLVDRESKSREFRLRPDMVEQASRMMVENGMLYNEISYDDIIAK